MLVTTVTRERKPIFREAAYAREVIETLYRVQQQHPFFLYGFVIMTDHCHFLLRVPEPETISKIMNVFKSGVTFNLGLKKLWQSRFHIHYVEDASEALHYIYSNPIKAGLSETPEDYLWSSASGQWDVAELGWM